MTVPFRLLLLAGFVLAGLAPRALHAQNAAPVRVVVHHFSHQVFPGQAAQFPDYFAYDPAWTWALQQRLDSLLQTRFPAATVQFTQQEPVRYTIQYAPGKMPSPPAAARQQADLFVTIRSRCQLGSQSQVGQKEKYTNKLEVSVQVENAAGQKVFAQKAKLKFGSTFFRNDLRPMGRQLISPVDFQQMYEEVLTEAFRDRPASLGYREVKPPAFDMVSPEGQPAADFEGFMARAETARLLQKNRNLFLNNAIFVLTQPDSANPIAFNLREEIAADRLAGAVATEVLNGLFNGTDVHKVKRFQLLNSLSPTPYRLRVQSEATSFGVSTTLTFLQDKSPFGTFGLVGYNAFNGTLHQKLYYLVYNRPLNRVLIYEEEGLSLMVNLAPARREESSQLYDLYFYPGLPQEKKADLINVYLGFRVAKILEANAFDRKKEKVNDASKGNR